MYHRVVYGHMEFDTTYLFLPGSHTLNIPKTAWPNILLGGQVLESIFSRVLTIHAFAGRRLDLHSRSTVAAAPETVFDGRARGRPEVAHGDEQPSTYTTSPAVRPIVVGILFACPPA